MEKRPKTKVRSESGPQAGPGRAKRPAPPSAGPGKGLKPLSPKDDEKARAAEAQAVDVEAASRRFVRRFVILGLVGLLFCAGQVLRLNNHRRQVVRLDAAIAGLYETALGSDSGESPFGRLQFERGKLLAGSVRGIDVLGLLQSMSRYAPESLRLEGLNLSGEYGAIRGQIGSKPELERYLKDLEPDPGFAFVLERDEQAAGALDFILRVEAK
ncbi:MAG: hypothetical protein PHV85_04770 [Desulfovibrionaceae bacterium]|nr:hypothetical protein [Desulfovibrionaceae bacterium]